MPAYLKGCERHCCKDNVSCGVADPMAQRGDVCFESREDGRQPGEEEAEKGDEKKLNESKGGGLWECVEDRFRGRVCEGRGHVPDNTKDLTSISNGLRNRGVYERSTWG